MDRLKDIFQQHRDALDTLEPTPDMWAHVATQLADHEVQDLAPRGHRSFLRDFLGIAAMLLLVVGLAWVVLKDRGTQPRNVTLANGSLFPEVNLRDPQGNLVPLSSLKGKVVLVEFWASYSTVCTETNCYHYVPVYEQYKGKGFEIYAISIDSSARHWQRAIDRDQLPWINVADLSGALPPHFPAANPQDLPKTYLLDREGKIIGKNLKAPALEQKLAKLFGE